MAEILVAIGDVSISQGKPKQALEPLERTVAICEKASCNSDPHGRALFDLARVLVVTGGDKGRAIRLSKQAQEIFSKTPKRFTKELKQVDAWLKRHDKGTSTTH